MKNVLIFILSCGIFTGAILIGAHRHRSVEPETVAAAPADVPSIGRIRVLNGCGIDGLAHRAARFLRENKYDVKEIGNAPTWNYPFSIIVSHTRDMRIARTIAKIFDTEKLILMRTGDKRYTATVIVGPDMEGMIR